jgi:TolA-binding protein
MSHTELLHTGGPTRDALYDFIAGRLHPDAAAWISVHVQTCPECTAAMERVSSLREALEPPVESPFQRQKSINAVRRRLAEPAARRSRKPLWISLSTTFAVAAALLVWFGLRGSAPTQVAVTPASSPSVPWSVIARQGAADVEVGDDHVAASAHKLLPQGGMLSVQPGSRVMARWGGARVSIEGGARGARMKLESSTSGARTLRLERGRVALDVDPLSPGQTLAVLTADAKVTVHGTVFLVETTDSGTRVAVERGVVRVERNGQVTELTAGQQLPAGAKQTDYAMAALHTLPATDGAETLDVFAASEGAQVTVDGIEQGTAPISLSVSRGTHKIRVVAPNKAVIEENVEVTAGAPALFHADPPEPSAAAAPSSPAPALRPATEVMAQARAEVLGGQYKKAIGRLESLRQRNLPATDAARATLLQAEALRLDRQAERAVPLYERVAKGSGPEAEQGQFQLAQTLGRDLLDPRRAAKAWADASRRFPSGIFREESAFRLGESLLAAGESRAGVEALERYLSGFPKAAHVDDAHLLIAGARRDRLGDCAGAIPHLRAVAQGHGPRAEQALVGQARCLKSIGRADEARAAYQKYLSVSPRGRFADEARENAK